MNPVAPLTAPEKAELQALVVSATQRINPRRQGRKRTIAAAVGLVFAGALAGGAVSAAALTTGQPDADLPVVPPRFEVSEIAAFERPPDPEDALPATLPDYATGLLLPETSRFVGDYEDVAFYVVQSTDDAPFCILIYPTLNADEWTLACGDGLPMAGTNPGGYTAQLSPRGQSPEGWIVLDENLSVQPVP